MKRKLFGIITAVMTAVATLGLAGQATALPQAPEPVTPVTGIPTPCPATHPWPGDDATMDEIMEGITTNFGFELIGPQWTDASRESIKILWESLDAVGCTTFTGDLLAKVGGNVGINAASISGFAWGDWSLTRPNYVTLDFSKFQGAIDSGDKGRLARLVIHEFSHVLNSDRFSEPAYWQEFKRLHASQGRFSEYAGNKVTENFADAVGYYVGRCAQNNPYDTGKFNVYYEFVRDNIFDGMEFGPAPGEEPTCNLPDEKAEVEAAELFVDSWVDVLSGE